MFERYYRTAPTNIDGTYSVVGCDRCGTIYQAEVVDADMLCELYESWVDTAPRRAWASEAEWLSSNPAQSRDGHKIMTAAAIMKLRLSDLKTLDYGMGTGALLKSSVPAQNRVRRALSQIKAFRTRDPAELDPAAFPFEHLNAFTVTGLEVLGKRFGLRRVTPTRLHRFAFLRYSGSVSMRNPRNALKELAEPFTSYEASRNLTMWFDTPVEPSEVADHQ